MQEKYTTKVITLWYRPPELLLKAALVRRFDCRFGLFLFGIAPWVCSWRSSAFATRLKALYVWLTASSSGRLVNVRALMLLALLIKGRIDHSRNICVYHVPLLRALSYVCTTDAMCADATVTVRSSRGYVVRWVHCCGAADARSAVPRQV